MCAAFAIDLDGERIATARIAYGGMAAIPARAKRTEAALQGQPLSATSIERAVVALAEDFKPLTDMRASADYRLRGARICCVGSFLNTARNASATRTHMAGVSA